jgi:hypothetical protein
MDRLLSDPYPAPRARCKVGNITYGAFSEDLLDVETGTPRPSTAVAFSRDAELTWIRLPMTRSWVARLVAFDAVWPPAMFLDLGYDAETGTLWLDFENEPNIGGGPYRAHWHATRGTWSISRKPPA